MATENTKPGGKLDLACENWTEAAEILTNAGITEEVVTLIKKNAMNEGIAPIFAAKNYLRIRDEANSDNLDERFVEEDEFDNEEFADDEFADEDFEDDDFEDGDDVEDFRDDDDEGTGGGRRVDRLEERKHAQDYEPDENDEDPK